MSKLLLLNKKKIVFFTSVMGVGGVARVISLWSNYFSKNKISTEIVSFNKKDIFYSINQKIKHLQIHFKESYFFYDKVKNLITIYKLLKKKTMKF